ncbi:uncharacterized protein LOC117896672 [Drosophila subobscura]|uniref:uncharacterized protein LOC117896672 n=1 Tax=Drosophila subobscura TaxID=7241 RepID=UPI00155A8B81|nr:uncharacterized protein LOC117896672 [Drosophila subobscura]
MGSRQLCLGCLLLTLSFAVHTASQAVPQLPAEPARICKATQILTENKGCVDRETYLDRVLMRTWVAEDLDTAKKAAGIGKTVRCKPEEILTATGCTAQTEAPRLARVNRAQISHSKLQGEQVVKSDAGGGADSAGSPEVAEKKLQARTQFDRPKILGHNRKRKFVFLPGRQLESGRKCRPYEVLAKDNRCIRKLVHKPTGKVEHKDHEYGLQRRHRHGPVYSNSVYGPGNLLRQ